MLLKEGERLRCPKCGGKRFAATAHVTQEWELDEFGQFQCGRNDCEEVTHEPDQDDIWECLECGYSGAGREFIVRAPENNRDKTSKELVPENTFHISVMAQHLIETHQIEVSDSKELCDNTLKWAKSFASVWAAGGLKGDYREQIEDFAEEMLRSTYSKKNRFKQKMPMAVASCLARGMIADLGKGESENGDRWSNYFELAWGLGEQSNSRVTAALGEQKHLLPESEWRYCLHVINDVDGTDCELYYTEHLDEGELACLLGDLMQKMWKGEM